MKEVIRLLKAKKIDELIDFFENNERAEPLTLSELKPRVFKTEVEYKKFMHEFTLAYSIQRVKKGLNTDDLISVYVSFLDINEELINDWYERVHDLFTLYTPEVSLKTQDLKTFLKIKEFNQERLYKEFEIKGDKMGMDFEKKDMELLKKSVKTLHDLKDEKNVFESRIKELVEERAPNTSELTSPIVAARLITAAGSLKRLMLMPSSTIQVIGAEKALFRHLRGNAKPPKHGIIFHSKFVNGVKPEHRGKMARALASKIAISVNVDYFKGEPIAKKLIKELEEKRGRLE